MDFSDPYYYASIVCLVKSDGAYAGAAGISGFSGAKATSQLGTVWYDACLPQIPDVTVLPAQESVPAMLVALDSGAVDLVVTDQPTAAVRLQSLPRHENAGIHRQRRRFRRLRRRDQLRHLGPEGQRPA